jgi:toluene monooxygenase electron transfer component
VQVFGPLGRATFHPDEDRDIVALAGGSGIAGIMSILEHATQCGHFRRRRGAVYFGVRTLSDGFYLDRLARHVAAADGNLNVVLALSHETPNTTHHLGFPGVRLGHGFVHDVAARDLAGRCDNVSAFVAGPPPMVDGAIRTLLAQSVPSAQIRYDKFG